MLRRPTRTAAIIAAGLAVALGATGVMLLTRPQAAEPPIAVLEPSPEPATASPAAPTSTPESVGRSDAAIGAQADPHIDPPIAVRVASIGLDVAVVPAGVRADGQMDVPELVTEVGWYRYGPEPGSDAGSALLSGHVDSTVGPAPMAALFDAEPGAAVEVTTAGGQVLEYRVQAVERFQKAVLPVDVLFARDGAPVLRLVTCAGAWDAEAQAYEENIVVTAVPLRP